MATLYTLTHEWETFFAAIEDGELTAEAEAMLQEIERDIEAKAEGYCQVISELRRRREAREAEAKRLRDLAETDANLETRLKGRLKEAMERMSLQKIETPLYRVSIAKNGGKLPIRFEGSIDTLPSEFIRTISTKTVDMEAVQEALKDGFALPEGFEVLERGTHLRIS